MNAAPLAREALNALVASMERDADEDEDEDAWAVTRDAASWAARAVLLDAPCASEAFGATAVGAVDAAAERSRLTRGIRARAPRRRFERSPRRAAASGAADPPRRRTPARRVVHAFAPFAPQEGDDETGDVDPDGEMTLDAWDASVDAASLADAAAEGRSVPATNASERANLAAKMALAGTSRDTSARIGARPPRSRTRTRRTRTRTRTRTRVRREPPRIAPAPAAHASSRISVRFACESIAEAVEKNVRRRRGRGGGVVRGGGVGVVSSRVASRCRTTPRTTPRSKRRRRWWRRASAAGASASALAAMTAPTAAAAAAVIEESDDAVARRAAARALAAVVAVRPETVSADASVVDAAKSFAEAAAGRRSARAAAHLLVAVAAASPRRVRKRPRRVDAPQGRDRRHRGVVGDGRRPGRASSARTSRRRKRRSPPPSRRARTRPINDDSARFSPRRCSAPSRSSRPKMRAKMRTKMRTTPT